MQVQIEVIRDEQVVSAHTFFKPRITIGRGDGCDVVLDHADVWNEHASITTPIPGRAPAFESLASSPKVSIDGHVLSPACPLGLNSGDTFQVGPFTVRVSFELPRTTTPLDTTLAPEPTIDAAAKVTIGADYKADPEPEMAIDEVLGYRFDGWDVAEDQRSATRTILHPDGKLFSTMMVMLVDGAWRWHEVIDSGELTGVAEVNKIYAESTAAMALPEDDAPEDDAG